MSHKFLNDIPPTTPISPANRNIYIHGTRELTLSHSQFTTESSPHLSFQKHKWVYPKNNPPPFSLPDQP